MQSLKQVPSGRGRGSVEGSSKAGHIVLIGLIGTGMDSLKAATGFISYLGGYQDMGWLSPLWITAIWVFFAFV